MTDSTADTSTCVLLAQPGKKLLLLRAKRLFSASRFLEWFGPSASVTDRARITRLMATLETEEQPGLRIGRNNCPSD